MARIFNIKLLVLFAIMLSAGWFTACKKDGEASAAVELLSFGPTGAKHGDTISFIGNNLHKVTAIELTGAMVPQAAFISHEKEMIRIKVPNETVRGVVKLKTPEGDIVSKSLLNLGVKTTVTSFSPKETRPGTNVTITGDYLNWVTRVTFARDKMVSSFVSQSRNELVVTIPMDAQTGPLVLFYGGTDSADVQTTDTLKLILPAITGIAPTLLRHADNLTITGTNLDLVRSVTFTGHAAPITSFVSQSPTQIVVKVPAGTRKGKISITSFSGINAGQSAQEIDLILPAVTAFSPNPTDTLVQVTITGTNLDLVAGITFSGTTTAVTNFVSQSPTEIVVQVPAKARRGRPVLSVKNATGTVVSGQILRFTFDPPQLANFPYAIYTDALQNGWQDWSFTASKDFSSVANVREGDRSIKATYGGNGFQGITFNNSTGVATTGYTSLEFSVLGESGTGGKDLNVVINGVYGSPIKVKITEGSWTTYSIPVTTLPATVSQIVLQAGGFSGVLHIDHVGLR